MFVSSAQPDEACQLFDLLSGHVDAVAQRDPVVILGDLTAVMRRSDTAPFVTLAENSNTEIVMNLVDQHDLFSANTMFRKPQSRLATFIGCKRPKRKTLGPNAKSRFVQLDHVLLRSRDRRRVLNCDTVRPLAVSLDHKVVLCDLRLRYPLYRPPKRRPMRNFNALKDSCAKPLCESV